MSRAQVVGFTVLRSRQPDSKLSLSTSINQGSMYPNGIYFWPPTTYSFYFKAKYLSMFPNSIYFPEKFLN